MYPSITETMLIDVGGDELELPLTVEYQHHAGYRGDMIDPPEPAHVELQAAWITPVEGQPAIGVLSWLTEAQCESLQRTCMEDWQGRKDEAAEHRYEMQKEDRDDRLNRLAEEYDDGF